MARRLIQDGDDVREMTEQEEADYETLIANSPSFIDFE